MIWYRHDFFNPFTCTRNIFFSERVEGLMGNGFYGLRLEFKAFLCLTLKFFALLRLTVNFLPLRVTEV